MLLPRYRLAPEHPWPAMLDDALTATEAIAATGPYVVGGVSAGGHLALAVALRRPPNLCGVALLSPNTDRSGLSRTREPLSSVDPMNDAGADAELTALAFGDRDPADPEVSPLLADVAGLAPLHIEVGSLEVLLDDSLLLARSAAIQGLPLTSW